MTITLIIFLSFVSAVLYRIGGDGRYDKLWRRLGCALIGAVAMLLLGVSWEGALLSFPLMYGALTTYHDYLNNGHEDWKCWAMTGFVYGVSAFPSVFYGMDWHWLVRRALILSFATMIWSEWNDNPTVEETGRGWLFIITMLA